MRDFFNKLQKIFTIPLWCMILLCVFSAVALVFIFTNDLEEAIYAYVVYLVSAYALVALCLFCVYTLPPIIKNVKSNVYSNRYLGKLISDKLLKTKLSLYLSFLINFVYIFVNAFAAIYNKTAWFGIFAFYYAILAVMRFMLARFVYYNPLGSNTVGELKRAKVCSLVMLTLNFALTAAVLMMMYQDRGFEQHGLLIYVIALYTFYSTINAIIDGIKYRKLNKPIVSISTMIKLAEALVSMLLLETSMLAQFGADNTLEFKRLIISLTGGGIALIITFMSVYVFVMCNRELNSLRKTE